MKTLLRSARGFARWARFRLRLFLLLAIVALAMVGEGQPPGALSTGVDRIVSDVRFDFWGWEADAIGSKLAHWLLQPQRYLREPERSTLVREYAIRVARADNLRLRITSAYADPAIRDPDGATAQMRAEWGQIRAEIAARQPLAEAIIEEQVGVVLAGQGFGALGAPHPPVGIRFTPLPYMLVVSPRERIETAHQQDLEHGLDVAQQEAIEEQVDATFEMSSLVTSIGGLAAWPAMLLEQPALDWVVEVSAHEWTHHYLGFHRLGWEYDRSYEARTINETTASIVGREIGRQVLARFYPDLVPPEEEPAPPQEEKPQDPPAFDFRAEMHTTRVEVDRLLAEGQVEQAERYMEERRQFFWEHGYRIRKLNQAYFAFHGSYADEPGAAGEDPVGPAVRRLRERSPSLHAFLTQVDGITTLTQLQRALADPIP
jgi:hypothetical protein